MHVTGKQIIQGPSVDLSILQRHRSVDCWRKLNGRALAALAAADVWTLPSRSENFGIAVAEALAAGRAVVVSPGVNIAAEIASAGAGVVVQLPTQ